MSAVSYVNEFKHARRVEALTDTAIVVPCYNEADRLNVRSFLDFLDVTKRVRLIFVNDGSSDRTVEILRDLQQAEPARITALSLTRNSGKAEAVRQGILHAVETGAQLIGYWDADLATPLDAIPDFQRVADRFPSVSVVFGSRRPLLGHRINRTLGRRFVSKVCAALARQAIRLPIGDTQCGAKLLRNTPILRDAVATPFTAGWLFDVELFTRISTQTRERQKTFYEFPLMEWEEIEGSKVSTRAILRSGVQMLRIIAGAKFGVKPKASNMQNIPAAVPVRPAPAHRLFIEA